MRMPLMCALCFALGCGPSKPTRELAIYPVDCNELYRVYRNGRPSPVWDNCVVQLRADAKCYIVADKERKIHLMPVHDSGLIVCECVVVPSDNSRSIIVTGVCRGVVSDGIKRTPMTNHYVRIEACSVVTE